MMPSPKLEATPRHSWRFEALGTAWEIVSSRALDNKLKKHITHEIEEFDATYSRFRDDSIVRQMARQAGEYTLPESAAVLFSLYDQLFAITAGKVTPLIGDTLVSAGYDAHYSLQPQKSIVSAPDYKAVVRRKGSHIVLAKPVLIDIGAAGKGYLVDYVSEVLKQAGHESFVVDGSGDMRVVGKMVETVGLENPDNTTEVIGVVKIENRALCASAGNRRKWGDWHHIIDPITNQPVRDIVATWVIAETAMVADGLATALFFTDPQTLAKQYTYEYMRLHANGSVEYSAEFAEGMFE